MGNATIYVPVRRRILGPKVVIDLGRRVHDMKKVVHPLNLLVKISSHPCSIPIKTSTRWVICIALLLLLWEVEELHPNLFQPLYRPGRDVVIREEEEPPFTASPCYFVHDDIVRLGEGDDRNRDPIYGFAILRLLVGRADELVRELLEAFMG